MVATRIDFLGLDLLLAASISCSRHARPAGTITELSVTRPEHNAPSLKLGILVAFQPRPGCETYFEIFRWARVQRMQVAPMIKLDHAGSPPRCERVTCLPIAPEAVPN